MLVNEVLLTEDVSESKDLMTIASFIAHWAVKQPQEVWDKNLTYTLKNIATLSGKSLPRLNSSSVHALVYEPIDGHTDFPVRFAFNHPEVMTKTAFGVYHPPPEYLVDINLEAIKKRRKGDPSSTIAHELQHALDDLKSGGRALPTAYVNPREGGVDSYLMQPLEINARFTQALWDLAVKHNEIRTGDIQSSIEASFKKYRLESRRFKNPKNYRRLLSRAYKFLDDVATITPGKTQETMGQKVRALIKKWLPFKKP